MLSEVEARFPRLLAECCMDKKLELSSQLLLRAYQKMLLIRKFEEKVEQLYNARLIGGFCHLYIGQEAVAVGICECLERGDAVITSYRGHGLMLALGSDPCAVMAELCGRSGGYSGGKGGSMHMFDTEHGFYGGHGIVGAQVPIGTGLAFAFKYRNQRNVSVTLFGDGALNQGQVYESFNIAKLWNLPVLFIVENNQYALGTAVARGCSTPDSMCERGVSFGIPGKAVDGMSFIDVFQAVKEAVEYVKENSTPVLLEMKTYRYRGHSVSDPAQYRTREELQIYREKDCVSSLRQYILENKRADEEVIKSFDIETMDIVQKAIDFAQNSKEPGEEQLYTHVYAK